jgi:hypothetical protein
MMLPGLYFLECNRYNMPIGTIYFSFFMYYIKIKLDILIISDDAYICMENYIGSMTIRNY